MLAKEKEGEGVVEKWAINEREREGEGERERERELNPCILISLDS